MTGPAQLGRRGRTPGPVLRLLLALLATGTAAAETGGPGSERLDFTTRILPILTRHGCNAGACHGAATGQGGFRLSLLGYDPAADHFALTRELGARRIDPVHPADSLFLRKASDRIDHEGGRRIRVDSPEFDRLRRWVAAGAPFGPPNLRVAALSVEPRLLAGVRSTGTTPLRVTARLTDGTVEDVTPWALYSSNDDAVAAVDRDGRVTVRGPGTTALMIRYGGQVEAVRVEQPFPSGQASDAAGPPPGPATFVDRLVFARLERMGLPVSPLADDLTFLRRSTLDLAGRLPTPGEVSAVAAGMDPGWRDGWIDRLVDSGEAADLWTLRWADLLRISGRRGGGGSAAAYQGWLRQQVAANRPWDALVRDLLVASGDPATHGPAGFLQIASDPRDLAEAAAGMFLGLRIGCARCHAHPADRWTREDHHRFAAHFARVRRDGGRITEAAAGEVEDPATGQPLAPAPLGGVAMTDADANRRERLAGWLTAPDNPWFARAVVNRVWRHLMGRGLVEPVDDLRPTNPATHPDVLDALADHLVRTGFDLRDLVRTIARSRVYQLSSRALPGNAGDDRLHSHARVKAPSAQVFLDMVADATGIPEVFPDQPDVARAVRLVGVQTPSHALDVLGRCGREQACEPAGGTGGGLAMALHLINGHTINDRLAPAVGPFLDVPDPDALTGLHLRTVSRPPSPGERAAWGAMTATGDRREVLEDLLWALLNGREFGFIH